MAKRTNSKESSVQLFNRYVWLIETIRRHGRITLEEINEKWINSALNSTGEQMPNRTFHNHRNAIEQMFDLNIECDIKGGYKYYIEESSYSTRDQLKQWLLNSFSLNNLLSETKSIKENIIFEDIPSGYQFLSDFLEAIRDQKLLRVHYQAFDKVQASEYELEVYGLKVFRQRWYALAYCRQKEELRTYSLDRVLGVETTELTYSIPDDFDLQAYFKNAFGIMIEFEDAPEPIQIKVYGKQRYYIETLPLHHSQRIIEENDTYAIFELKVHTTYDFLQELLSHGPSVELVSPQWLREEFAEKIKSMYYLYN